MNKAACQYALLRFRPFVETGEFANVGVVLMAPEAQFFHQLDRKVYLSGRELFKEELERFAAELRHLALDGRRRTLEVELVGGLFSELVRPREAMLHFDGLRLALARFGVRKRFMRLKKFATILRHKGWG